jgi:hypothetical protein
MGRRRSIIPLRILLGISPTLGEWLRTWSRSPRLKLDDSEDDIIEGNSILMTRIKMRNLLSSVYFGKTKDVINDLRSQAGLEAKSNEDKLRAELAGRLGGRKVKA